MAQLPGIPYNNYDGNPSTNAPGGGDISVTQPGPAGTGAPNSPATGQASPQDLEHVSPPNTHDGSPVHHTYVENTFNVVDQSDLPHNGVDAAQTGRAPFGMTNPTTTGAGGSASTHGAN